MIGSKKVLAITLARGGSKSIPKKNLALLAGKPLIDYTIEAAKKSELIDTYVVSTDDPQIKSHVISRDVRVIDRPLELASDTAKSGDAILHALDQVDFIPDYVVELMCTNPLKSAEQIDGCIQKLHDTDADAVVSVTRVYDQHPARVKYVEDDQLHSFFPETKESRRQDLEPAAYIRNGSIYAFKLNLIRETGARYGRVTRPYVIPDNQSVNIDEPFDLLVAQHLLEGMS